MQAEAQIHTNFLSSKIKCLLETKRVCLVSFITCSPQFKEKSFQFSGTANMQVTTDLISTSWNTERNLTLSALIAKHRKNQKKCGKKDKLPLSFDYFSIYPSGTKK